MIKFSKEESKKIRSDYIKKFLKTSLIDYKNGKVCNNGYFWEDFKNMNLISEKECLKFISEIIEVYVVIDIFLNHKITNTNIMNEDIVSLSGKEFLEEINKFPEDVYVFDQSLKWTIALTHETNLDNSRFCLIQK